MHKKAIVVTASYCVLHFNDYWWISLYLTIGDHCLQVCFGRTTPFSYYCRIVSHDESYQLLSDECWCVSSQSHYTTASPLHLWWLFSLAHVALDPIETPPNGTPETLSSFKESSNLVCEVQQVSGVEWSPCGIVSFVCNKGMWNYDWLRL